MVTGTVVNRTSRSQFTTAQYVTAFATNQEVFTSIAFQQVTTSATQHEVDTSTTTEDVITYTSRQDIVTNTTANRVITCATDQDIITSTRSDSVIISTTIRISTSTVKSSCRYSGSVYTTSKSKDEVSKTSLSSVTSNNYIRQQRTNKVVTGTCFNNGLSVVAQSDSVVTSTTLNHFASCISADELVITTHQVVSKANFATFNDVATRRTSESINDFISTSIECSNASSSIESHFRVISKLNIAEIIKATVSSNNSLAATTYIQTLNAFQTGSSAVNSNSSGISTITKTNDIF